MIVRLGFVSNSSSSSYTCTVCGNTESGWDLGLTDAYMFECEKGHVCCDDHRLTPSVSAVKEHLVAAARAREPSKWTKENPECLADFRQRREDAIAAAEAITLDMDLDAVLENEDLFPEGERYEAPDLFCPVCQLQHVIPEDVLAYLLQQTGRTKEEVETEIKSRFKVLTELRDFVQEDK